jgi:coenzyme F420-0:L-glutamate ligase/coenzyme F420-1:gamma-L-glutamate ligase
VAVVPVDGIGEVRAGDDLAQLVAGAVDLRPDDIVVVTSKIVSKAEGRAVKAPRTDLVGSETARVVASRDPLLVVRNRLGLVMAGAGIDASNTESGSSLLLPRDPDASARQLRAGLRDATGLRVGVVVSDTAGRAWRRGQTDIAIGAAGVVVTDSHAGRLDPYGNLLAVTEPAIADELAAAGDLVKGKLSRCPVAIVRGLPHLVTGDDGPGATALIRPEGEDLFGLGSRQAVLAAIGLEPAPPIAFGEAASADALRGLLGRLSGTDAPVAAEDQQDRVAVTVDAPSARELGRAMARVEILATGCGWAVGWTALSDGSASGLLAPA